MTSDPSAPSNERVFVPMKIGILDALASGRLESPWLQEKFAWLQEKFGWRVGQGWNAVTWGSIADRETLAHSRRQQPASPFCRTDSTLDKKRAALDDADAARSPKRRDVASAVFGERFDSKAGKPSAEDAVRIKRALFM